MLAAKIGVASSDGIGQRNEPTLAQLDQDGFPFSIAKPGLCQQFLFRDDGIVDGEAGGIEKSVESSLVEILDEDVGIYEDRDFCHASISSRKVSSDCLRPCFRSAVT